MTSVSSWWKTTQHLEQSVSEANPELLKDLNRLFDAVLSEPPMKLTSARKRSSDKADSVLPVSTVSREGVGSKTPILDLPSTDTLGAVAVSGQSPQKGGALGFSKGYQTLTLDNSALSEFRRCPRRGQHGILDWVELRKGLGMGTTTGPKNPFALSTLSAHQDPPEIAFGLSVHKALDLWWRKGKLPEVVALFESDYGPKATHTDKRRGITNGVNLLKHYHTVWGPTRDSHQLLATEVVFRHFLGKWTSPSGQKWKFYYTGRIDKTLRGGPDSRIRILDHKTTTSNNPGLSRKYQLNRGFLGYLWATNKMWDEIPVEIIADIWVLSVGGVTPTREPVEYHPERIREWKSGVLGHYQQIATWTEALLVDNQTDAFPQYDTGCDAWFRLCPFMPLCENPKVRDRLIRTQFQPKGRNHLEAE